MNQTDAGDPHNQFHANNDALNNGERKTFYLRKNNQQFGPYNLSEVIELLKINQFTFNNLACIEGMSDWEKLGDVLKSKALSEDIRRSIQLENWEKEASLFNNYGHNQYYGVNGWLLLFCVGLTILGPLFTLGSIGQSLEAIRQMGNQFPSFTTLAFIEVAMLGAMVIFSIYTGISLWTKRPKAVATARIYLVFVVLVAFADFILLSMSDLPEFVMREVRQEGIIGIVRAIIYAGVWTAYLSNSKRVQATYAEHT